MNPVSMPFWVVVGVAATMIATSIILAIKIRSLKKSRFVEKQQKSQITDLSSHSSFLETNLIETRKEFKKTQGQLSDFKDIEARENAEINSLKKSLEAAVTERDQLKKDNAAQKENIFRQGKESEKVNIQLLKLEKDFKELRDKKEEMAAKIQELESSVSELSQTKVGHLETLSSQKQELEQLYSQRSELNTELQTKEQDLHKLENTNRGMSIKIEELEAHVEGLSHVNEADQKTISGKQQELEQALAQRLELRNTLAEKEQQIQKIRDANEEMAARIQELESHLKVSNEENVSSQQVITHQDQELERTLAQNSELQDTLGEKKQQIQKLEDASRQMAAKIQELESSVSELSQTKAEHLETLSSQKQGLERMITKNTELQSTVKEKEQHIQKLEDVDRMLDAQLKEYQPLVQGLQKETLAQSIIMAELKKKSQKQDRDLEATATGSKDEQSVARDKNAAQLAELLSVNNLVAETQLKKALQLQKKYKGSLLRFLFVNRDVDENKLVESISSKLGVPYLPVGNYEISDKIIGLIPSAITEEYWLVPIDKVSDEIMVVMIDPFENTAIKKIEELTGCKVQAYIGLFSEIAEKIQSFYQVNIRGLDGEGNPASPLFIKTAQYQGRERRRAVRLKTEIALRVADDERVFSSTTNSICWDGLSFQSNRE